MMCYSEMLPEPYPVLQKNSATYDEEKGLLSKKRIGAKMSEELYDEDTDIGDYFGDDEIVNTNNTSGLKPCPFCGSEDTVRLLYNDRADVERCRNCNLSIIVPFGFTMWNNRPIEDALRERAERTEQMVERLIQAGNILADGLDTYWQECYPQALGCWHALVAEWSDFLFKLKNDGV